MGCNTTGVRGIRLGEGDKVVSLIVPRGDGAILTATQTVTVNVPQWRNTQPSRVRRRGYLHQGYERNGLVVGAVQVDDCDQIMMITDAGTLVRTRVSESASWAVTPRA
ncbi:DNA gyrase subunit A [Escherichia coli]|nr:DNA gyrase subunit A [Escherichia coli]